MISNKAPKPKAMHPTIGLMLVATVRKREAENFSELCDCDEAARQILQQVGVVGECLVNLEATASPEDLAIDQFVDNLSCEDSDHYGGHAIGEATLRREVGHNFMALP